jgi:two-component system sensor histidine kinase KdpD
MDDETERLFYLSGGPLAAILLGMAFVPLRDFTTASNFTFAFLALTIAVAEFGGRWPAVATALVSALSLDFFLTKPYLRLVIDEKHDMIAFAGLTVCGLVAAAFGSQRSKRVSHLKAARNDLELLHAALRSSSEAAPLEERLAKILDACRSALPLAAALVRDPRGYVLAASAGAHGRPVPDELLDPDRLQALPEQGGRLALVAGARQVGWLDLFGNGARASGQSRRTLSDVARLVALMLVD